MGEIKRISRGEINGEATGRGSVFMIPREDMPDGLVSGEKQKVIIEGLINTDEQGATIKVDRIYFETMSRENPLQKRVETALNPAKAE